MSSHPSETIRIITFDVGDTLIRATPSVGHIYSGVCANHGIDLDVDLCNRAFERAWKARSVTLTPERDRFSSAHRGEEGYWEDLVGDVMRSCGVSSAAVPGISAFREAFASPDSWAVFEEVEGCLTGLGELGYDLAVLSNWDSHLPRLLDRLDLHRHFQSVFVSAVAGVEKPHPRFFEMVAEGMQAEPHEILHVGDRIREDYEGARAAGMSALWIDRYGHGGEAGSRVDPSHIIGSLAEIGSWLENGGASPRPGTEGPVPAGRS